MSAGSAVRVRPAQREDAAALVRFQRRMAWETEGARLDESDLQRGIGRILADPRCGRYLVAELEDQPGRPAGTLLTSAEWSDWRGAWIWWITSVWVEPFARRRGVYRTLYAHLAREARATGDVCSLRLYVERANHGARRTYRELGMRELSYDLYWQDLTGAADSGA